MNWRVEFRPEVEQDVANGATWYEARQPGLGAEFVEEVIRSGMLSRIIPYSIAADTGQEISAGAIPSASLTAS